MSSDPFGPDVLGDSSAPFVEDELRLIHRLIEEQLVDISYQPIIDLGARSIFAYEAFARPSDGYFRTPTDLIEAAVRSGSMARLGRHMRALALRDCERWPLFLNLEPNELSEPLLTQPDEPSLNNEHPVYLEISEAVPAKYFQDCRGVLAGLRDRGVRLAIDNFGAGSASLKAMLELEPDIVKLDRELVIGCAPESREFTLLQSITELCHSMGSKVIAEGIETLDELKACMAADIDFGQGFFLSVPHNPPPSFFWPPELPEDTSNALSAYRPAKQTALETESTHRSPAQSQQNTSQATELANAAITISRLQEELDNTNRELEESRQERSLLVERVKRLTLEAEAAPQRERPRPKAKASPPRPQPAKQQKAVTAANSNEEDALDFLRRIEEERALKTEGES